MLMIGGTEALPFHSMHHIHNRNSLVDLESPRLSSPPPPNGPHLNRNPCLSTNQRLRQALMCSLWDISHPALSGWFQYWTSSDVGS